jgi:hypothetical protein
MVWLIKGHLSRNVVRQRGTEVSGRIKIRIFETHKSTNHTWTGGY